MENRHLKRIVSKLPLVILPIVLTACSPLERLGRLHGPYGKTEWALKVEKRQRRTEPENSPHE